MIRAFQWDLARQVERLDWLLAQLPKYSNWGYNELYLHLEDSVDYPSLPGVTRSDAYSWNDFERLVATAGRHGIGVVPIANLLGHTQYLIKHPDWRDLNELRARDGSPRPTGQICPSHPRTPEVAQRLINDLAPFCTAGKLHVGLDESFHIGKHPKSVEEVRRLGRAGYFADYVTLLNGLVSPHGLQMGIWADMLILLPEAVKQLPSGIAAYDWYYHGFQKLPRFELHNFSTYDLQPVLAKQGIDYWVCPMNGAFRHEPLPVFGDRLSNAIAWWERAHRTNASGFLVTSWEPHHLTPEVTTMVDAAIASLWLDDTPPDHVDMLQRGLERSGLAPSLCAAEARIALSADDRAFAGYARAERNQFWDTPPLVEGQNAAAAEEQFFTRASEGSRWAPLRTSLRWRTYLASREKLVRSGAASVLRMRRLFARNKLDALARQVARTKDAAREFEEAWHRAQSAANAMWELTRKTTQISANATILERDRVKLDAWLSWLESSDCNPAHIMTASPMVGTWQLLLTIHATRPNANLVVIQQQDKQGEWHDVRQRHTIEFRSVAARRRSRIKRAWSVPIEDPGLPVRIAVRGKGEVAVSRISLTNGVATHRNQAWPSAIKQRLGEEAPNEGWVDLDWANNLAAIDLNFAPVET